MLPLRERPDSTSSASRSSTWRWMARRSGRAPMVGSKPTSTSSSLAAGVRARPISRSFSCSSHPRHHQLDDVGDLFAGELAEDDDLVHAVEELGPEDLLELAR